MKIKANGCQGNQDEIRYLEHVQLVLTLDYSRRGDLAIDLTSPMGTKSRLLTPRGEDLSDEGFLKWPFMTTHSWGEDPRGTWTLEITDEGDSRANRGFLKEWGLVLHGTKDKPPYQRVTHPETPRPTKPVPQRKRTHVKDKIPDGPTYIFAPSLHLETVKYKPLNEHKEDPHPPATPVKNVYSQPSSPLSVNTPQQAAWTSNFPPSSPIQGQPITPYQSIQNTGYYYPSRSFQNADVSSQYYGQTQPRFAYNLWSTTNTNNAYFNYPQRTYTNYGFMRARRKRKATSP